MEPVNPYDLRLNQLRKFRNTAIDRTSDLAFLKDQFQREVARPRQQLKSIVELWEQLVPAALLSHTRLESLQRGVLRVVVDSSGALYELDRLLRGGLQNQIISQHKGPAFRKVQLRVGEV